MKKGERGSLLLDSPYKLPFDVCCGNKINVMELFGVNHVMPFKGTGMVEEDYVWVSLKMQEIRISPFADNLASFVYQNINSGRKTCYVTFWVAFVVGSHENNKAMRKTIGEDIATSIRPYLRMDKDHMVVPGCGHTAKLKFTGQPREIEYGGDICPRPYEHVHVQNDDGSLGPAPWCAYLKVAESLWLLYATTTFTQDDNGKLLTADELYDSDSVIAYLFGTRDPRLNVQDRIKGAYPQFKTMTMTRTP